ncbi:DUF732 domain-containing protein [Nocardia sp. NPDC057668]|uniref:DUF732 domain-containing protein n=1 Tax=Nocardia sp. NPDC057668 TaxID=3346202 RepID=UPI003671F39C
MRKFAVVSLIALMPFLGMGAAQAGPFDTGSGGGSSQPRTENERRFLQEVEEDGYIIEDENDVLSDGYAVCGVLRNGGTKFDAVLAMDSRGLTEDAAIDVTIDASFYLCPEFRDAPIG